jgi:Cu/Ag efflux pump CusA
MRWLVGTSLKSRGLVAVIGLIVLVFGFTRLGEMPKDVLPEFKRVTVEVQQEALGLSAQEVESLITSPLEQDLLSGVAFVDFIRSESVPGLSRIEMVFEPGTDEKRARQVVNERLTQAHANPAVSGLPQMLQPRSSTNRVMMIGLESEEQSLIDLGVLARWTIRPALLAVPGVSNVAVWGQREQQLQVRVDPARLAAAGVTLEEVISTSGNSLWSSPLTFLEASTPGAGGFFETQSQRIGVEHAQPIETAADLSSVVIEKPAPAPGEAAPPQQRLADVTDVILDHQPLIGDGVFTDGPGLMIVVEKFPEANAGEVTDELEDALDSLDLRGITADTSFFEPADYINEANDNLRNVLIIGAILALIALGALLFDLRSVFVAVVSTLVAMSAAIAFLWWRGETLNSMVLGGLVLALLLVVDDAVVTVDAIRRGAANGEADDPGRIVRYRDAVLAVRSPLAYGTVIALLLLVPILVLGGEPGAFMPPLVVSYAWAVVAAFIVALTVAPALSMMMLRHARTARVSPVVGWLQTRYDRGVGGLVRGPLFGIIGGLALLIIGLIALPFLDRGDSVVPEFEDRDVLVDWEGPPGMSLEEMQRITARAGQEIGELDGVENVGGHVGRAILGDQIVNVNEGELWVSIAGDADYSKTFDAVEEVATGFPGITGTVRTYPRQRVDEVLERADGVEGKDMTVRVFGANQEVLDEVTDNVFEAVADVDGVENAEIEAPVLEPTLEVEVDLDRAQAVGVKPGDVRRTAATLFNGIVVGHLFEDQKIFEVTVEGVDGLRNSVDDLRNTLVDVPSGGQVRLGDVANVSVVPSPSVIKHEDISRYVDIGFDVDGRDLDAVANDLEVAFAATDFPMEYHAEVVEDYGDTQDDRLLFIGLGLGVLIAIFLLLQVAAASWRMATALFVALPGALAGGLVAAAIDGELVTIGTLVGFLGVYAYAARHAVVFVQRCHGLEDHRSRPFLNSDPQLGASLDDEGDVFGPELVRTVAAERLGPTLVSAAALFLLFLPMVFAGGPGLEVVSPMAVVLVGGIISAALLNLFVVPALYLRFGQRAEDARDQFDTFVEPDTPQAPSLIDA